MIGKVDQDRGLGTAYERWAFYQRLDAWARAYDVRSFVEGPIDGMAGIRGVHGVGLARRGVKVTSTLTDRESADLAGRVYGACDAPAEVRVVSPADVESLPEADMVLAYHALPEVADWRGYLRAVAKKARKVLVVSVCNPDNWGVAILRTVGRLRGVSDFEPPECWTTEALSPELWALGRVKDHAFFDAPWWPDLQVAPGQSLLDRARRLVGGKKKALSFTSAAEDATLAARFVYDDTRWPYFGGPGWVEELFPAIARHPAFDGAAPAVARRAAHLHAFVVDVSPRLVQTHRRSLLHREA